MVQRFRAKSQFLKFFIKIEKPKMLENFLETFNERLCRLCLGESDFMDDLFKSEEMYPIVLQDLIGLKIMPKDDYPHLICNACCESLHDLTTFKSVCLKTEEVLRSISQNDKERSQTSTIVQSDNIEVENSNCTDENSLKQILSSTQDSNENLKQNPRKKVSVKKTLREKRRTYIKCKICGKSYTPSQFRFHMNTHNNVRPYVCPYEDCKKTFPSPFQLKSHKTVVHTNIFPFKCDICGHPFKVKTSLIIHRSYHTDPEIPCSVCGKLVRNKRALKKHMMVHTGERPFPCDKCDKSFQTKYTLNIHQRSHTGEKPFVCSKCGIQFAHNCALKSHMSKFHPENIDEF